MKKSVQKKQNTFSKKTAEKRAVPCGQNNHGFQRVYPVPGYLKNLGIETMEEPPGWTPAVFSLENPKVMRPQDWKPEETPEFLQGSEMIRVITRVRLYLSSDEVHLLCAMHDNASVFRGTNVKGQPVSCVLAEILGTETYDLYRQDWCALRSPELRPTMDVELLLDSVDMGRMVYKTVESRDRLIQALAEEMDKSRQMQEKLLVLKETLGRARPKLLFADSIIASQGSISMGDMAKLLRQNGNDMGRTRLFEMLRGSGVLSCQKGSWNKPLQWAVEAGYFEIEEGCSGPSYEIPQRRLWSATRVTPKGQAFLIEKLGKANELSD